MNFSKSKYCGFWQCPKMAWLDKYKPEQFVQSDDAEARLAAGNEVGDLAMGLFGDFVEVTEYNGEKLDLTKMIEKTKAEMEKGTPVICEASFVFEGNYCAVDILRRDGDGWAIYEVKSSTDPGKPVYAADVAYQKYVLENCGVRVTGTYIVTINGDYVFDGTLDIKKLFKATDISSAVGGEYASVEKNLEEAEALLRLPDEPDIDLSPRCCDPYECGFWSYCSRHLPKPSVFDLYRLQKKKKFEYYYAGKASFEKLSESSAALSDKQARQIDFELNDRGTFVDKENVRSFLSRLSYPLFFLDFETVQYAVPRYVGTGPYAQIPFQYSLHFIEREGSPLCHREFLAEPGADPRRALAEALCRDIPESVCVTAYNKGFECGRIAELADAFPDLHDHLLSIAYNIFDLLTPFQSGWYYNRAMGGSFSIKSVLPALYPDDPSLDYHNLEGIHHGGEAMAAFPAMEKMSPEERETTRRNLLKYCELDTFALVKVWEALHRAVE